MTLDQALGYCQIYHLMIWYSGTEVLIMKPEGKELRVIGRDTLLVTAVMEAAKHGFS